ncbi:sensor histidine kinase [Oscillibacter sp.]|jgi:signal transduction histidine kinase|uniref:sensor histidine kinase n=1 Tax=Oscillibacter sp. TaxID=1945593 RepID=UPI0021709FAD|nr:sensor histidine kinase [Oscillibacter sp.]MCI9239658.1 sensor histidine kinase [Oscillibacter sp.]
MDNEKNLSGLSRLMFALNLSIILFYSLVCLATTLRICGSFGAYDFLSSIRQIPPSPWRMTLWALGQYLLLCAISFGKARWEIERYEIRLVICLVEILLCAGITSSLEFYYSGTALLVLADLVHYMRNSFYRICFIVVLILLFSFGRYEILYPLTGRIPFSAYLDYYNQTVRSLFAGAESLLVCLNVLLFVLFMILLFTGQKAENSRIRKLNQQLNQANDRLRDYAFELERMTEVRERNRLAREIHDTLGHTLTGIIMGSDAGLALFDAAPEEAKKRIQVVAQAARNGLNDVRRSIKALRPDALENTTLAEALETMISNFKAATSAEVFYDQQAGLLVLAQDEEDTLYRVLQESMTNAVRHGRATEIHIHITRRDNLLTIDVRDNGCGCGAEAKEGFGLRHMRERLELLGGSLTFGNRETLEEDGERGFYIVVSLPIREKEEEV